MRSGARGDMLSPVRAATMLRIGAVATVLAASTALLPPQALPARSAGATSSLASLQSGVLVLLNQIRRSHGLQPT